MCGSLSVLVPFYLFAATSAALRHTHIHQLQSEANAHILIIRHRHGKQNKSLVMSFQLVVFGAVCLAIVVGAHFNQ